MVRIDNARRRFCQTAAGTSIAMLAGCMGGGGDGGGGGGDGGGDGGSSYPESGRQIRAMIPFGTGGGYDWYTRTTAPFMEKHLPNDPDVVPENVEGGGGLKATNQLANSDPDGYTYLLRHGLSSVWQQIGLPDQATFDVRDLTDLGQIAVSKYGVVQSPDVDPIESWDDLVSAVTQYRFGTGGVGDAPHLFIIVLGRITGEWSVDDIDFVHYDGFGPSMSGMDRGEVELTIAGVSSVLQYLDDGVANPVVAFTGEDEQGWDGAPSITEWDLAEADQAVNSFRAPRIWSAPPDLPADRRDALDQAFMATAEDSEFQQKASEAERPINALNAADATAVTEGIYSTWKESEDLLKEVLQ